MLLGCALLAISIAGAACTNSGTVTVTLVTAPNSTVLDSVETLELTLTDPLTTQTATRTDGSFTIDINIDAAQSDGSLIVLGLDDTNALVATGASPPFPTDSITAAIAIYMAAPNSVGASPVALDPACDQLAVAPLTYGVLFAGGRDGSGSASDAVALYDAYNHTSSAGVALPAPSAAMAAGVEGGEYVYFFGGTDSAGSATATDWGFDTTVSPNGGFNDFGVQTGYERAGQSLLAMDEDLLVLTGKPAATISSTSGALTPRTDVTSLPATALEATGSDDQAAAIFVDASGVTRYRDAADKFDTLGSAADAAARDGAALAALPNGQIGVFCGGTGSGSAAVLAPAGAAIDLVSEAVTAVPNVPSDGRIAGCAVAATDRFLVIAGGTLGSGGVATTAEIYDATTFAPVATAPLVVPRTGATAIALPTGQVLIVGGDDATGAPIATIELFTPAPDPQYTSGS